MSLRNEEILPSIVVIVDESKAPSRVELRRGADAGQRRDVVESPITVVLVEGIPLVGQVCHYNIRPAVIVVIGEVDAHSGKRLPFGVHRHSGLEADFLEGSIRLLMKEELGHRVIGDKNIHAPVVVVVGEGKPQGLGRLVEPQLMRNLGEIAVAVVVIHKQGDRLEDIGVANAAVSFAVLTAPDVCPIPGNVAGYNQVEQAVVIQVDPPGRAGPAAAADSGLLGDIGKGAVAVVVVEAVASVGGYENILVSIVVVVGDCNAHAVPHPFESSLFGNVLKGSVGLLVIHAVPVFRTGLLRDEALGRGIGIGGAVDQEEVEPAVIVAIEERHARAHRLKQIFACGVRGNVHEMHAGLLCDVDDFGRYRGLRRGLGRGLRSR